MHTGAIVAHNRLWHKGRGLTIRMGDIVYHILKYLSPVGTLYQTAILGADFALPSSRNLMMMHLYLNSHFFQCETHGRANIMQRIHRRNWEITTLYRRTMAGIAAFVLFH